MKAKSARMLFLIVSLAVMLFFIAGCSSLAPPEKPNVQLGGFLGGNEGLFPRIIQGAPPEVILDRERTPFSFVMTVENIGEAKVGEGTENPVMIARLVGFKPSDFGMTPETAAKRISGVLEPAKRNLDGTILPGEITDVAWDDMAYKPVVAGPSAALTLRAELCYDYTSEATAKICMKKEVIESAEDLSICGLKGLREFGNSGAPLQVTAVEQLPMGPGKIQIKFNIEHFGRGIYFYRNAFTDLYDACEFNDLNQNMYKVEVSVEPVQERMYTFDCSRFEEKLPSGGMRGIVKTSAGAPATVNCFITRNSPMEQRVYEDLVQIKLKYRYGEFVEVPILVQGFP